MAETLKKIKVKRIIAILIVVALGIFVWRACFAGGGQDGAAANSYLTAQVDRGDIVSTLSGSGTLEPADSYTVTTLTSGEILSANFEEGDTVEKDQML